MNVNEMFLNPERLWFLLIIPVLIALYVWVLRHKRPVGMRFTNTAVLAAVVPHRSQWRRHLAVAMSLLSLVALIGAWSRPNGIDRVPRERATIVMVIDCSRSMLSTDVQPTRLDAAKTASKDFVKQVPAQYNISIVSLSGNSSAETPATTDRNRVLKAIDNLQPADSTGIGDAINVALNTIASAPKGDDGKPAPGAIVLLSDGGSDTGRSVGQEAQRAADAKVPISTIAYGTPNGSVDLDGQRYPVPPDTALLAQIAQTSHGQSFTAENAGQLDSVYKNLATSVGYEEVKKETTALWAGYGLVFAVIAALAAVSLGARWP